MFSKNNPEFAKVLRRELRRIQSQIRKMEIDQIQIGLYDLELSRELYKSKANIEILLGISKHNKTIEIPTKTNKCEFCKSEEIKTQQIIENGILVRELCNKCLKSLSHTLPKPLITKV